MLQLLIDSDSCPASIRTIILRACRKNCIDSVFAADRSIPDVLVAIAEHTHDLRQQFLASGGSPDQIRSIRSPIQMHVVATGDNSADDYLVSICQPGSLSVTRDILLANRLIERGSIVITDRGQVLDSSNIAHRLSEKNVNSAFREAGMFDTEQNTPLLPRDIRTFSNSFNSALSRLL